MRVSGNGPNFHIHFMSLSCGCSCNFESNTSVAKGDLHTDSYYYVVISTELIRISAPTEYHVGKNDMLSRANSIVMWLVKMCGPWHLSRMLSIAMVGNRVAMSLFCSNCMFVIKRKLYWMLCVHSFQQMSTWWGCKMLQYIQNDSFHLYPYIFIVYNEGQSWNGACTSKH